MRKGTFSPQFSLQQNPIQRSGCSPALPYPLRLARATYSVTKICLKIGFGYLLKGQKIRDKRETSGNTKVDKSGGVGDEA